jgi:hypothetical protein
VTDPRSIYPLPVEPCVGLTVEQARSRAESEGRELAVYPVGAVYRTNLVLRRIKVFVDEAGTVVTARAG